MFFGIKSPVDRIVLLQLTVTLISASVLLMFDRVIAYSSLCGGLSTVIPGLAVVVFNKLSQGRGLRPVVQGELWKFALSIICFTGVFVLVKPLSAVFYFGAFIGTQLLYAVVPLIESSRRRSRFKI